MAECPRLHIFNIAAVVTDSKSPHIIHELLWKVIKMHIIKEKEGYNHSKNDCNNMYAVISNNIHIIM